MMSQGVVFPKRCLALRCFKHFRNAMVLLTLTDWM
jgi:hypothetical protein